MNSGARPLRCARALSAAAAIPSRRPDSHRIPARPRSHHPLECVPPAGLQDPGVRESRRRSVSDAHDALAGGGADRRSIARALRLNETLIEAISLAHDLGHTPFGHAGQDALNACMRKSGGFEHNLQSLRVVDELEERYAEFRG